MRYSFLVLNFALIFTIICLVNASNSHANPLNATGSPSPTAGGGSCDWSQYKDSIKATESSGRYTAFNGAANSKGNTANGMYQFIEPTANGLDAFRNALNGSPSYPAGCTTLGAGEGVGFNRDECSGLQEAMMDEFSHNNLIYMQNNCPSVVQAIQEGRVVSGGYRGNSLSCPVTWSGVLAGAHLGGTGSEGNGRGICGALSGGNNHSDNLGTSIFGYVCQHGGLQVPAADCSPADYSTGNGGTYTPRQPSGWGGNNPPPGRLGEQKIRELWVTSLELMTTQLSTVMMQQVAAIGMFFDAKHQLETQRLLQLKYARAHKDYQPSVQMCEIGTLSRDLANSKRRADLTQVTVAQKMIARALATGQTSTAEGSGTDTRSRLQDYIDNYCNVNDNNRNNTLLCDGTAATPEQKNIDIDFTRLIDAPLTLNVNFANSSATASPTDQAAEAQTEKNLFTFLNYIFMHEAFPNIPQENTTLASFVVPYQEARAIMAMRSVAQNSFAHLIAVKSSGPKTSGENIAPYLKALMREMGLQDADIIELVGENPSYYAQMEVLTKMAQDPRFVTELQGKPANVRRVRAAMTAIKLMQDRDINEALMRREMLISMILELKLREKQADLQVDINNTIGRFSQP